MSANSKPPAEVVSFDDLLAEAQRPPVTITIGGEEIVVEFPTGEQAKTIEQAANRRDDETVILTVFGDEGGKKVLEALKGAPADMAGRLMDAVWSKFGITPGNLSG